MSPPPSLQLMLEPKPIQEESCVNRKTQKKIRNVKGGIFLFLKLGTLIQQTMVNKNRSSFEYIMLICLVR